MRMKRFAAMAVVALCLSLTAQAQYLRTSYFMEGSHYGLQLNPALQPARGYVNVPVIGSMNASVTTSLNYQDVIDIINSDSDADFFTSDAFLNRHSNDIKGRVI